MKLKLRTKLVAVGILAIAAVSGDIALWRWLKQADQFPILSVKVAGHYDYIGAPLLQQTLAPYMSEGLFGIDKKVARKALLQISAVQSASIIRVLPYTVLVTVQERKAVVRWNDGTLMTAKGEFFTPSVAHSADNLPLFVGQQSNQQEMLSQFYQFQKQLAKQGLSISTLWLTDTGSWRLQVTDGAANNFWIYLGAAKMHDLLDGFLTAYPVMMANATPSTTLIYVDLRYHNGFAAKWTLPVKKAKNAPATVSSS
ncbi:MAG: cell division protein FtsQ/DivIB [Gammaproteobacteria bacterium]|nr:cell division protein FtsQ/DivIB [Gammaproteobacteria bacterium]